MVHLGRSFLGLAGRPAHLYFNATI